MLSMRTSVARFAFLALLVSLSCWFPQFAHAIEITDFIATNVLPDGEIETRIRYRGVSAKETAVLKGNRKGLKYRELSDGKHFIQLVYDGDEVLRDCEFLHDYHQVIKFLKQFHHELRELTANQNLTITSLDGDDTTLNPQEHGWFHYANLRDQCRRRHRELKLMLRMDQTNNTTTTAIKTERSRSRSKRAFLIMPGTYWCGLSDASSFYTDLGGMESTDKCCRIHDHCKNNILPFQTKFNYHNTGPFTISHCFCDARCAPIDHIRFLSPDRKRGIGQKQVGQIWDRLKRDLSDMLRVPETKWCGKGYSAKKPTELGGLSPTDKCCRKHDTYCPFWIGGFETKYGLFNWRVNTLMHCGCDERFRACLKMVGTSDANIVGKIFFNIVQTKCFVIKKKPVCKELTWWGKCVKKKSIKQAVLRSNPRYK